MNAFANYGLSARESEVLWLVSEGKTNSEIALHLGLSPRTVEKHVEHVLDKLGVQNRTAAARIALTSGKAVQR